MTIKLLSLSNNTNFSGKRYFLEELFYHLQTRHPINQEFWRKIQQNIQNPFSKHQIKKVILTFHPTLTKVADFMQ